MFQSPSLRGSGRFACPPCPLQAGGVVFQSPSLRGSGRFARRTTTWKSESSCFNPLHCGAVVASSDGHRLDRVHPGRFNPLHCGAVVASVDVVQRVDEQTLVSIPFIAGQWSLLLVAISEPVMAAMFQSPSLRGSGRFGSTIIMMWPGQPCFNPLHCGAVVASVDATEPIPAGIMFQSPSLRGSGRFSRY